jgi:hypothetical protein
MIIEPSLPPHLVKTYQISQPLREVSCETAGCEAWHHGMTLAVDETTELGQRQAAHARADKTRSCTETRDHQDTRIPEQLRIPCLTFFIYPPQTRCFAPSDGRPRHRAPWDGRERLIERDGDWRGNPRGWQRVHVRAEDFLDSWANHQGKLAEAFSQG